MEKALIGFLLLIAAGLIAYLVARPEPSSEIPELAVAAAGQDGALEMLTDDPGLDAAAALVLEEFGQRLEVPRLPEATFLGLAAADVAPGVEVPVLLYERANGPLHVYVFSYALLDQTQDRLRLAAEDYDGLVRPSYHRLQQVDDSWTLLWRDRDDLFLAVADTDLTGLADALFPDP